MQGDGLEAGVVDLEAHKTNQVEFLTTMLDIVLFRAVVGYK